MPSAVRFTIRPDGKAMDVTIDSLNVSEVDLRCLQSAGGDCERCAKGVDRSADMVPERPVRRKTVGRRLSAGGPRVPYFGWIERASEVAGDRVDLELQVPAEDRREDMPRHRIALVHSRREG